MTGWDIKEETYLKAQILTRGVRFTNAALQYAAIHRAKGQNMVYNMPLSAETSRPQEMFLEHEDGFRTVVSCVSPSGISPVVVDADDALIVKIDNKPINRVQVSFVPEPDYYQKKLSNGETVKKYVTACGYDELNIIPWKGCASPAMCRFCGSNNFVEEGTVNAISISDNLDLWQDYEREYLQNLRESVNIAKSDSCYSSHMHVILISGNLHNDRLDDQALFYANIAKAIHPLVEKQATEGIVVVITPPKSLSLLTTLKKAGVNIVVFNLEAGNREYFNKHCPGKAALGYDYFVERLVKAVDVFGWGNAWCNFVFGLEPQEKLLPVCEKLANLGIATSANVLHLDKGNTLDCGAPSFESTISFFYKLNQINCSKGFRPFYCAEALRTSLSNEAYHNRIAKNSPTLQARLP